MRHFFVRNFMFASVGIALVSTSILGLALVVQARQDSRFVLHNQTVPLTQHAHLLGAANGQQQLNLSVGLQLRNQQELENLLSDLYDPRSPLYHHFLTPQEFASEFAPTAQQQQQVVEYLRSQGLTVTNVSPNGLLIDANATVSQADAAFQVKIGTYRLGMRTFFANANPPALPASLSSLVVSIGGLDNSVQMHPLYHFSHQMNGALQKRRWYHSPLYGHQQKQPRAQQAGYGPADLLGAYDGTPLQQAGIQGNNQAVALFELDGYSNGDIAQYLQNYNLGKPDISNVLVDGFDGAAGQYAIEVDLDIEVVAAMAPKATQIVYEGPGTIQGINDTYNQIVTDNKAQILTTSWGACESQLGSAELQTLDTIYKQGAAQGITMFAASGDSGAYGCNDNNLAVDAPASDPFIIGVGGTSLQSNGGVFGSESAWGDPSDKQGSPNGAGGGGGISSLFQQPGWQTGPGVNNQYSNGYREVPDISANADPNSGYAIYCTVPSAGCYESGWTTVGGTSAAAPLWAGSMALINEYLQGHGKSRAGFANPVLYALGNAQGPYPPFHDVTSGNNLYYPATPGYDLASGWGSPDIYNIARDIAAGVSSPPSPTPTPSPSPTGTSSPGPTPSQTLLPSLTGNATPPSVSLIQNGDFELRKNISSGIPTPLYPLT